MNRKTLLFVLLALLVACSNQYERTCADMLEELELYKQFFIDPYPTYIPNSQGDVIDEYMSFITENGDTVTLPAIVGMGIYKYEDEPEDEDKYDITTAPQEIVTGYTLKIILKDTTTEIFIVIDWCAINDHKSFKRYPTLMIDRAYDDCTETIEDDFLYIVNPNGDQCCLQKGVGIVEITSHDGRSWRPVK